MVWAACTGKAGARRRARGLRAVFLYFQRYSDLVTKGSSPEPLLSAASQRSLLECSVGTADTALLLVKVPHGQDFCLPWPF